MRLTIWPLVIVLATLFVHAPDVLSAESPLDSPEQKVLQKVVGRWQNTYKLSKAEWTPQERAGTADVTANRVLGGRFIQENSEHSDKTSSMRILTYDPQKKCYRGWWFSSNGQTAEHIGKWDEASKTMTWRSTGEAGLATTVINRFAGDDHAAWDVTVTVAAGKTMFRMDGTSALLKEREK